MSWNDTRGADGVHAMAAQVTRDVLGWRVEADTWLDARGAPTGHAASGADAWDPCTQMWAAWALVDALEAAGASFTLTNRSATFVRTGTKLHFLDDNATLERARDGDRRETEDMKNELGRSRIADAASVVASCAEAAWCAWRALNGLRAPSAAAEAAPSLDAATRLAVGYDGKEEPTTAAGALHLVQHMVGAGFRFGITDGKTLFGLPGKPLESLASASAFANGSSIESICHAAVSAAEQVQTSVSVGTTAEELCALAAAAALAPPRPPASIVASVGPAAALAAAAGAAFGLTARAGGYRCVACELTPWHYASAEALRAGNLATLRGEAALLAGACERANLTLEVGGTATRPELVASWAPRGRKRQRQ